MSKSDDSPPPKPGEIIVRGFAPTLGGDVYTNLPDNHSMYGLIGRVASEWAHFEHHLDVIIWDLAEIEGIIGACITAQVLGARPRFLTILALGKVYGLDEALMKRIRRFMNCIIGAQDDRNRFMHDPWYLKSTNDETAQFKSMPKEESNVSYGFKPIGDIEIVATINQIRRHIQAATELQRDIQVLLPALREKRQQRLLDNPPPTDQ